MQNLTPYPPLRHENQQGRVSACLSEAERQAVDPEALAHVRTRSSKDAAMYERGAREMVDFLAASGKTLETTTAKDVAAFKERVRSGESSDHAGVERARSRIEGACVYLRFKSCRGEFVEDEALFFALNERITPGVIASAFGASLRARVLRETAAFRQKLLAAGKSADVAADGLRAAVKLVFFLERRGKRVDEIELADWAAFEDEVKGGSARQSMLAGARAYLRSKGLGAVLGKKRGRKGPRAVKGIKLLSPESRAELVAFRDRLTGEVAGSTRHAYVWGARELLLFVERRGLATARLTLADWKAFETQIRAREARGELGRSWAPGALSGARRYLRERAERGFPIDDGLVPYVTPNDLETRCAVEVARDPREAAILREVEAFAEKRTALGYEDTPNVRQGAQSLLRFLLRRGLRVTEMTAADWKDFEKEACRGTGYRDPSSLLTGASAYLRIKVDEGVLAKSPVPPRPVRRAEPPALPEDLVAGIAALEEAMAVQDLAEGTRKTYRRAVWDLLAWASEEHSVVSVSELTRDMLTAYRLRLQSEPSRKKGELLALSTQIGATSALRFFFSWLVRTGRLLADPTRHLPHPRPPRYLPRSLEIGEITRLIRSLPRTTLGLRDRAMVELLYGTGMRRGELSKLDLADVDFDQRQILIREGKGRKDRVVPLGKKAKEALGLYLERSRPKLVARGKDRGALFLGQQGRRLSKGQVSDHLRVLGRRIHVKLAPHLLRHSCATHLLKGRADIRHIQRLLGHESLQTTERYTKVQTSDLRQVIDRCHPREKSPA
jgi:integrase/recombinase XerD